MMDEFKFTNDPGLLHALAMSKVAAEFSPIIAKRHRQLVANVAENCRILDALNQKKDKPNG